VTYKLYLISELAKCQFCRRCNAGCVAVANYRNTPAAWLIR
jgi:hypothetical protein